MRSFFQQNRVPNKRSEEGSRTIRDYGRTGFRTTYDFLTDGGSGHTGFLAGWNRQTLGIARDMIAAQFQKEQIVLRHRLDGRWQHQ